MICWPAGVKRCAMRYPAKLPRQPGSDDRGGTQARGDLFTQKDGATDVPKGFVQAASQALRGIQAVTLPVTHCWKRSRQAVCPVPGRTRAALYGIVKKQMRGHDASTTRLTLDR